MGSCRCNFVAYQVHTLQVLHLHTQGSPHPAGPHHMVPGLLRNVLNINAHTHPPRDRHTCGPAWEPVSVDTTSSVQKPMSTLEPHRHPHTCAYIHLQLLGPGSSRVPHAHRHTVTEASAAGEQTCWDPGSTVGGGCPVSRFTPGLPMPAGSRVSRPAGPAPR